MEEIKANIDIKKTLDGGQTFLWGYKDGKYSTVANGNKILISKTKNGIKYTGGSREYIKKRVGLNHNLEQIRKELPDDKILNKAIQDHADAKIVNDPFFGCVISFIISANNRIDRTKNLVNKIKKNYGKQIDGSYSFPLPETLARVNEQEYRDIGLGYRAPYVKGTSTKILKGEVKKEEILDMRYEKARKELKKLPGVGDKVSDCILLFSLGFKESAPLDTWILKGIEKYYPDLNKNRYTETSEAFREYFGKFSGFAQNFLFHYFRDSKISN